jgi:hypothetical protein
MPTSRHRPGTAAPAGKLAAQPMLMARLAMLLGLGACANPPQPTVPDEADDTRCAVEALLAAQPTDWLRHTAPVLAIGQPAVPALLDGLHCNASQPGAQAAVAVLGRIGGSVATESLLAMVAERGPLATEAAQALGELPSGPDSLPILRPILLACTADRFADATLRTTAAASLLRAGERHAIADFVRAVLLAGTPAGQSLQQQHHLPEKTRWALERYLLQRALLHAAGEDFGLDTDASWPDLEATTQRISQWLEGR